MSHIKDLRQMAEERGYVTSSAFLSEEERAKFLQSTRGERGASYFLLPENGERQLFVFYPSFMTEEECRTSLSGENAPFSILEIRGKQEKFAEKLSHRDILGAVMNLGITREQVGDILFQESVSYLFLLRKMKDYVAENLTTIRHTTVELREVMDTEGREKRGRREDFCSFRAIGCRSFRRFSSFERKCAGVLPKGTRLPGRNNGKGQQQSKGRRKNLRPRTGKVSLYRGGEEYQEGTDCSGDFEVCLIMK